jgi:hypothetical protein
MAEHFIPSPTKLVRFVDKDGKVTKIVPMNRARRRKLGIRGR